jgi:hypothetical protein
MLPFPFTAIYRPESRRATELVTLAVTDILSGHSFLQRISQSEANRVITWLSNMVEYEAHYRITVYPVSLHVH